MDLYDATIDGYSLEIEHLDDTFEKAIARHEFPNSNGALIEDMGQKARTIRFRSYFWDDGADHFTYADHIDFLNHLHSQELFELVHPMYGPLKGCVESVSVHQDDRQMAAEIDISFVEDAASDIPDVAYENVDSAAESAYQDGQEEQQTALVEDVSIELAADKGFLETSLDGTITLHAQFVGVTQYARELVKEVDIYVAQFEAVLTDVVNPANSLLATIHFTENLPGRTLGGIARAVERTAFVASGAQNGPARIIANVEIELRALEVAFFTFSPHSTKPARAIRAILARALKVACARQLALSAAYVYADDEASRNAQRNIESATAFDVLGHYTPPPAADPVMNARELEASLAAVRTYIQEAIDATRGVCSLNDLARLLLQHVYDVKLERERMVAVTLDNPLPLHLVCLKYGLPYNYAERITGINLIPEPNSTSGEVSIYAR